MEMSQGMSQGEANAEGGVEVGQVGVKLKSTSGYIYPNTTTSGGNGTNTSGLTENRRIRWRWICYRRNFGYWWTLTPGPSPRPS